MIMDIKSFVFVFLWIVTYINYISKVLCAEIGFSNTFLQAMSSTTGVVYTFI